MQNRFGLKDFFLLVLVAAVGLSVWLGMVKSNREWDNLREIKSSVTELQGRMAEQNRQFDRLGELGRGVGEIQQRLANVESTLSAGVAVRPGGAGQSGGASAAATTPGRAGARDESWAVPGVPVEWQQPWNFTTDPRSQAGFSEGGTFTELFEARPAKIVPYIQTDVYGRRAVDLVVDTLGAYDPVSLKLRGVLAEAWQMDPQGMWVRAKIRDDARFSDGQPVTAEDFRWSFHEFIMNPQIEAQRTRSILADQVDKVTVISERVVEIRFKQVLFSNLDTALTMYALPKHFYSKFAPAEINKATGLLLGSGPFKLERVDPENQWAPGQPIELVRNDQYWGPKPPLDRIRFRDITDELARLTAYRNNEADMITPAATQFVSLKNDAAFANVNQMLSTITMRSARGGIIWNCGERLGKPTPFTDKRVRRAMTMLLDREKMIRDIWRGVGQVAKGFMNPNFAGSDPTIKAWPYDPTAAKALLKEAGWEDRDGNGVLENAGGQEFVFEFTFFTGGEIAQRIATFVQDAMKDAGIRVILRGVDWSVGDPIRKQRDFDAMIMSWGANAPESDPKQIFHSDSIKDQGDNFGQWNSPGADKAIDALRREIDFDKRMQHWREFDRVMHDEQPYTWIRLAPETRILKPTIGNARQYPKGLDYLEFFRSPTALPIKN